MPNPSRSFFPRPPAPERVLEDAEQPPPQRHWKLLSGPPRGERGELFPIRQLVSQTADHAIGLLDAGVYSTGLSFRVALYSRKVESHREASAQIALVVGESIVKANAFADFGLREMPPAPQLAGQNPCGAWGPPGCTIREWWVWGWRPGERLVVRAEWAEAGLGAHEISIDPERLARR